MPQAHVIVHAWHLVRAICGWFYSIFYFYFYFFRINFNIFIKILSIHVRLQLSRILVLYSYKWFMFFVFLSWYILFAKKKIFSKRTSFWGIGSPITVTLPSPRLQVLAAEPPRAFTETSSTVSFPWSMDPNTNFHWFNTCPLVLDFGLRRETSSAVHFVSLFPHVSKQEDDFLPFPV